MFQLSKKHFVSGHVQDFSHPELNLYRAPSHEKFQTSMRSRAGTKVDFLRQQVNSGGILNATSNTLAPQSHKLHKVHVLVLFSLNYT